MKFLAFGEVMLRLAPEGFSRFAQSLPGKLVATYGGGEANVSASLALLGDESSYMTALPDNPIAQALLANLRSVGVQTNNVLLRKQGRMGVYYLETGANQRSSNVTYDREGSAISLADPDEYDFNAALEGVGWVHITGITPSLSEKAFLSTLRLAEIADALGASISCDLNFRKKLWRWKKDYSSNQLAEECMSRILPHVDLVIANEEDAADVLGIHAEGTSVEEGKISAASYEKVAREIVSRFPNVSRVAITLRESISASHNNWGGMLYDAQNQSSYFAPLNSNGEYCPYEIRNIVDRVGGGDSFAAGLLHALNSDDFSSPDRAISFAVASSCLKHSIPGDFNYITREEVVSLAGGQASGRVRR